MIYKSSIGDIDLRKLTRLYPAAVVDMYGEIGEMSLEWANMNSDKVKVTSYILVFDFTPIKEELRDRKVLSFETKDELITAMKEVSQLFGD